MEGCKERAREGGEERGRKLKVSFSRIFLIYLLCSGLGRGVRVSKCCEYNSEWICLPFFCCCCFGNTIHRVCFLIPIYFSTELFNQGEERRVGAGGVKAEINRGLPPSPRGNPRNAAPPASYALPGARFLNVGEILIVITIRITQTIAGNRFTRTRKA